MTQLKGNTATIAEILSSMPFVTLSQMDSVKLMNRVDKKFVTSLSTLVNVLYDAVKTGYKVLDVGGTRWTSYDSIYFDTSSLVMFTDHRSGRANRRKVRMRKYLDSSDCFLEVKRKNNKGRTKKKRKEISAQDFELMNIPSSLTDFLFERSGYAAQILHPCLSTRFKRITLVDENMSERLTIDTFLHFKNFDTSSEAAMEDCVIIELKQDGRAESKMRNILLSNRVRAVRFSKYCMGTVLTNPNIAAGRFGRRLGIVRHEINKTKICQNVSL